MPAIQNKHLIMVTLFSFQKVFIWTCLCRHTFITITLIYQQDWQQKTQSNSKVAKQLNGLKLRTKQILKQGYGQERQPLLKDCGLTLTAMTWKICIVACLYSVSNWMNRVSNMLLITKEHCGVTQMITLFQLKR